MIRSIVPTLLLIACSTPDADVPALPVDAAAPAWDLPAELLPPPGQPLGLDAGDVIPGERTDLVVVDANPGETVHFFVSAGGVGVGPCPAQLSGLCLDLGGNAPYLGSAVASASGVAQLRARIPTSVSPGGLVTFQAVAKRNAGAGGSVKSNAVERDVLGPWENPVTVDGDLQDWSAADERFDTTSQVGGGWVTWDADNLYVAFDHPDIASGGGLHWSVLYLGTGAAGSATGVTHNTQTPGLPFAASLMARRKADGSYDDLQTWDGASWVGTPFWLGSAGSAAAEAGQVLEIAIPRALLGSDLIELASAMVYEGAGFESTYAGVPSDTFADGYDPDFQSALVLDLTSPYAPVVQNP